MTDEAWEIRSNGKPFVSYKDVVAFLNARVDEFIGEIGSLLEMVTCAMRMASYAEHVMELSATASALSRSLEEMAEVKERLLVVLGDACE